MPRSVYLFFLMASALSPLSAAHVSMSFAQTADMQNAFDEVAQRVDEHFYDAAFGGADWTALKKRYRVLAAASKNRQELAAVINEMLAHLKTSHTKYYTKADTAFYDLLSIFAPAFSKDELLRVIPGQDASAGYVGIGITTTLIGDTHFVRSVFDGGPADQSGIQRGQAILSADGELFHPVHSFAGKLGQEVAIKIQKSSLKRDVVDLVVRPVAIEPQPMMLEAMQQSMRIISVGGHKIAYVHVWSYAGQVFHDRLKQECTTGTFKDADGLILDLRDGWGGASTEYLNLFNKDIPLMTWYGRGEPETEFDSQWRKPVVALVNEGTRSGKELIAFGFKKYNIGKVIGTRTAGAVTGGRLFLLNNGDILYLAVRGVKVDGQVLEGIGVEPDIQVDYRFPFGPVEDPQLDRALEILADQVR